MLTPDHLRPTPSEALPPAESYTEAYNRFVRENGGDIEATKRANRTPVITAELDDDDGAIELPPELSAFMYNLFGQQTLCVQISLIENSFTLRMQTVHRAYHLGDDDIVYIAPKDEEELPTGMDKDVAFEIDTNTYHVGIYRVPSEFGFSGWQSSPAPFDVANVGMYLIEESVNARVNNTIVLRKNPSQET